MEKNQTEVQQSKTSEDFEVTISSETNDGATLVTGYSARDRIQSSIDEQLLSAFSEYDPTNKKYSAFLSDTAADTAGLTLERLSELAKNPQSDLKSITEINNIARRYINTDDIIGRTYESIETNVNTDIRLSYRSSAGGKKAQKTKLEKAKTAVDIFNGQISLNRLIRTAIPQCYSEGNYIMYLRNIDGEYIADSLPLGVAVISDYSANGEPIVMVDIKELENRLKKTQLKDKKGKPLFFDGVEKEIAANYPPEVLQAYRNKEKYAILDHSRTGVMRVNNLNRKYGLTPIFRALKNVLMLEAFARADNMNSKAAAKKIIFQKMRKESMGTSFERKAWEDMSYAHDKLARAFGQKTVLYTGIPQVEDISYVESKADMISIDTINSYRDRVMVTLGVSFLNTGSHSVSTANISINQLLLTINKIAEQLEHALHNWYRVILDEQGIGAEYAPDIKIIDSEQTSMEIKKSLVEVLFSKLNCSYRTAYEFLGVDIEDEKSRREVENDEKYEEVFFPRQSQYTSGDGAGRPPASEVTDKVDYDKTYNENR